MSQLNEKMTALADAIRSKSGVTGKLTIDGMKAAVTNLSIGKSSTAPLTVTPTKSTQTFSSSDLGENTYYSTVTVNPIPAEYILVTKKSLEVTPSKSEQVFNVKNEGVDVFYDKVTVAPIPSEYIVTTDATAEASHILKGKTAYVNGEKVTGTMANHGSVTERFISAGTHTLSNGPGYYEVITVTLDKRTLTVTPTQKEQTFKSSSNDYDIFYTEVKVNPIPSEYTKTNDATADAATILEGKTAYVNGVKITGMYKGVSAGDVRYGVSFGCFDILPGLEFGEMGPEFGSFTSDADAEATDILPEKIAYVKGEKVTGSMPVKSAENYTPGTEDAIIKSGVYLSGDQIIKGDSDLTAENIKTGISIFGVEGTFTADATAAAADITAGKTAYVNGQKLTGTFTGGTFVPLWQYIGERLFPAIVNGVDTIQIPSNKVQNYIVYNNQLRWQGVGTSKVIQIAPEISWRYARTLPYPYNDLGMAVGNNKAYFLRNDSNGCTATCLTPDLNNVVQVMDGGDGRNFFLAGTDIYVTFEEPDKYTKIEGISVSKILNQRVYMYGPAAGVITTDGSLAVVRYDYDCDVDGKPTGSYDIICSADGDPFYTAYIACEDEFAGYMGGGGYALGLRSSGLWYCSPAGTWIKVDDSPSFKSTDLTGYCVTYADEHDVYDEETDDYYLVMTPCQSTVALQIDTEGRAWKIAAKCNDNGRLEGVELSLLDNETNWQYVPAQVSNGETHWAQKGGNLIRLTAKTENNVLNISWTEFGENPNGKLIGAFDSNLFFAPVSIAVDTTISGGEYSVV